MGDYDQAALMTAVLPVPLLASLSQGMSHCRR